MQKFKARYFTRIENNASVSSEKTRAIWTLGPMLCRVKGRIARELGLFISPD